MSVSIEEKIDVTYDKPKKYNLWAINNDFTSFDEVVFILTQALGMSQSVAAEITFKIDIEGKAKLNPKPMTKDIAEAVLNKINETKRTLAMTQPFRANQIMMLKFIVKED